MRIFRSIFFLFFIFFSIRVFSQGTDPQSISMQDYLPLDSTIIEGKLDNGLTYFIKENIKPENRAELRLVVNAGSILEDSSQQGLAHFVEHMAFNGTENFAKQEIIDYLETIGMRFGPDINAYTSFDETVYMLQIPTDSLDIIEKAFMILSDWANAISFDEAEIEKERGVVIEEWRLGRGANSRMQDKQFPVLLHKSRYAERLPIGKKRILENFKRETLVDFYQEWYRPDLMGIIAVGDFEAQQIEKYIKDTFSPIPAAHKREERVVYPVPDHLQTLYSVASDSEATYSRISVYYKQPISENRTTRSYRDEIINRLYNRMFNARLSELTRSEDAPFMYATSRQGRMIRSKNFYILSAIVEDNGLERGLEALLREAKRVQQYGFTETELTRSKMSLLRYSKRNFLEREKTESSRFAARLVGHFLYQNPVPGIPFRYGLDKRFVNNIRLKEVNKRATEWISDSNRVVLANSPIKKQLEIPTEQELAEIINKIANQPVEPYVDTFKEQPLLRDKPQAQPIVSQRYFESLDVTEWRLANGIHVYLKPTDFKNDEIQFSAFSPGGYSLVSTEHLIAAQSATGIIAESGVGGFNKTELMKFLSGKVVRVTPYISELTEGFSGFASPQDIETLFKLIYLHFTSPRTDSTAFLAYQERLIGAYQNRSASPEAAFFDTLSATLTQYHPRYRPWNVETIKKFDLHRSLQIYRDRFADASDFTFIFVGNLQPDSLRQLVEQYIGGLPVITRKETWANHTYQYPVGRIDKQIYKGQEPKSRTTIIFTGPFVWNRWQRYVCGSMIDILRIRLRERVREDLGGTYSVGAYGSYAHFPYQRYRIGFQFGSDPQRIPELTSEIYSQIDSLIAFGTTEKYLQKVKETQLRSYETNLKKNNFWISNLEYKLFHNEPLEDILNYPKLVEKLSLDDIQTVARRYLNPKNVVQVTLYPQLIPKNDLSRGLSDQNKE